MNISVPLRITGDTKDIIKHKDGRIEVIEDHNIVVNGILPILASAIKGDEVHGISYWAIGSGDPSWDSNGSNPERSETVLTNEIGRKQIPSDNIQFIKADGNVSDVPTNMIEVTMTFDTDDINGAWREFALFAGDATENKDSGIMINKKHHDIISKSKSMIVERHIRFTFMLED